MGKIRKARYGNKEVEYDEDNPCIICGEPVIGASIGGTAVCGSCDMGVCRYCNVRLDCQSKELRLKHMQWHHKNTPDIVKIRNDGLRKMMDRLEERE